MEVLTRVGPHRPAPPDATGAVMMRLGAFEFLINSAPYSRLRRDSAYRWPAQPRIARRPALQSLGPGPERITLDGALYPPHTGGPEHIQDLRALAERGEPLMLTDGLGRIHGQWVVTRIEETLTVLLDNGAARKIAFRLDLARYGEDP